RPPPRRALRAARGGRRGGRAHAGARRARGRRRHDRGARARDLRAPGRHRGARSGRDGPLPAARRALRGRRRAAHELPPAPLVAADARRRLRRPRAAARRLRRGGAAGLSLLLLRRRDADPVMREGFSFTIRARDGAARCAVLATPHGEVATPAFMPVATYGAVRGIEAASLREIGASILLANTFHLHERPGEDAVAALGGLHGFTGWRGPWLTDSGGFQVTSLGDRCKVSEEGVAFS